MSGFIYSQNTNFKEINQLLEEGKNHKVIHLYNSIKTNKISKFDLAQWYFYVAEAYASENQDDVAFNYYLKSKKQFMAIDSLDKGMTINISIAGLLYAQTPNEKNALAYCNEFLEYAKKKGDSKMIQRGNSAIATLMIEKKPRESLNFFMKSLLLHDKNDSMKSITLNKIGVIYNELIIKPDSALFYLNQALAIDLNKNDNSVLCGDYCNIAAAYFKKKDYLKAIAFLNKAYTVPVKQYEKMSKSMIHNNLSKNYEAIGDYKNAFLSLRNYQEIQDEVNNEKQNIKISELNTQYKTQEKEIENLSLKNKIQTNNIIMYAFIIFIFFILLFGILVYKNISKKKTIADQEKLIEIQKLEKVLKVQELHEIDIMLESQEKERHKIANELHDNLGSLLATLKLNFQNLKRQKGEILEQDNQLYNKTDELIEDAYQNVRNIAHLKNIGIIGNEGLLKAVKTMAEKMTVIEKLKFNVIPFGLKDRLDNKIAVTLFRMIQELCTNIIKHSEASEVNIYITQNDGNDINIMIEDNGKGFDSKTIEQKDGIGLKSIEKKVEQLSGTFTIDSLINKGTTIIIDIPL